jgi:hypothetical protein
MTEPEEAPRPSPDLATSPVPSEGFRAQFRLHCVLLGIGLLLLGLLLLQPLPPGLWHDDGVYLLLGRALAHGDGLRYIGVPGDFPASKFPPGYPFVLSLLWRISDNPYGVAQVAGVLNVMFLAGAAALTAWWGRALGLSVGFALGCGIALALSVELWQTAVVALSEPLFILVMVVALIAAARAEREGGTGPALVLAGLLLTAVHVRTAGVALVPAAVVGLAARRRWRDSATVAVACGLGVLPWMLWSDRASAALPLPLRDILGGYSGWLGERMFADRGAYAASLATSLVENAGRFLALFLPGVSPLVVWVLGVPIVALLAMGTPRLARRSPTALCALVVFAAEIWLWPFPATRLVIPLLPIGLVLLACGIEEVGAWLQARPGGSEADARGGGSLVTRAAAIGLAAFAIASVIRVSRGEINADYFARARILAVATELIETTPPNAVVGAPELWSAIPLVTGRRAAPSAPFRPNPSGRGGSAGTPAEQFAVWDAAGIEYLFLEHEQRVHGEALEILARECPGAVQVVATARGTVEGGELLPLVRLQWDEECRARMMAR